MGDAARTGPGFEVPRRGLLAGGLGAASLGIVTSALPTAARAASVLGTSDPSFVQTASTTSDTGAAGFPAYDLTGITAAGSSLYVASYDDPGLVGRVTASDLTITGSRELSIDLPRRIASDGTHLYIVGEEADAYKVAKVRADDLSVVEAGLTLPGFVHVYALVVAGTELLVIGTNSADGGRVTKVTTSTMTVYGSLDVADRDFVDADLASPYLYVVSWTGHLVRILLTGGPAEDGGMAVDSTLDLDGDANTYAIAILDGHAYVGDSSFDSTQVRKVRLPDASEGMEIVGRLTLPEDEDFQSATTDGSSLFFGGGSATEEPSTGRVVKVRPTGGTAEGSGGLVRVGAVDPTSPEGGNLQQLSDLVHLGGSIYAVGDNVIVKLAAGT